MYKEKHADAESRKLGFLNLTIAKKLIVGLVFMTVMTLSVGVVGLYFMGEVDKTLNNITDLTGPTVETADDLVMNIWEATKVAEEIIADEELEDIDDLAKEFDELVAEFKETYVALDELVNDQELLDEMEKVRIEHGEFIEHAHTMFQQHRTELNEEINADMQLEAFDAIGAKLITMLNEFADENEAEMQRLENKADELASQQATTANMMNRLLGDLFEQDYPVVEAALKLQRLVLEMQDTAGEYMAAESHEGAKEARAEFDALAGTAQPFFEVLHRLAESEEDKQDAIDLEKTYNNWVLTAAKDEQLFDTHIDMLTAEFAADDFTEQLETDADNVAAALDVVITQADTINNNADDVAAAVVAKGRMIIIALIVLLVALAVSMVLIVVFAVTRPLSNMTDAMDRISQGKLDTQVPALDRHDEIGDMAMALQVFKENAQEVKLLAEKQKLAETQAAEERKRLLEGMANDFEANVGNVVQLVTKSANEVSFAAQSMSEVSKDAVDRSSGVAKASEEATSNVNTVASAAEQLSASIKEISHQVAQAAENAQTAAEDAMSTQVQIEGLVDASQKIGDVVELISDISEQTNLLALNATIEAARAGDAGKGFAVVASEVKALASETAKATSEIGEQISGVQGRTKDAAEAIKRIGNVVKQISDASSAVAAAVEQQDASTREIAQNVQQAATGTKEVNVNITEIQGSVSDIGSSSSKMSGIADALTQQSGDLRTQVEGFLKQVRQG